MQTTIHINLCGRVIKVADDAWRMHLAYIEALHNYFIKEQDQFEIINDIETRMAELMQGIINKGSSCISEQDMDDIIARMGTIAAFEELDRDDWFCIGTIQHS